MQKPQLILLDLDGTLVDTVPDLAYCLDEMLISIGYPPCREAKARDWIGNGIENLVRRAITGQMHAAPPPEDFARAYPIFLELYAANTCQRSTLYPGIVDGLEKLQTLGYPLACVTNKATRFAEPLLRGLGILDYFGIVVAGDTLPQKKPDPAQLLYVAKHYNILPSKCLMVGDSENDVRAARAAGFAVVCVDYGYNHGQDIHSSHPDAVIANLIALPDYLY